MRQRIKERAVDLLFLSTGAVLALILTPLIVAGVTLVQNLYDERHPPARMSLHEYNFVTPELLRMRFRVERLSDCEFVRMIGFSGRLGVMEPATTLRREDAEMPLSYPVGSVYLSPPWLMSPIFGPHVRLYGHYDCGGRPVKTRLIDQELK